MPIKVLRIVVSHFFLFVLFNLHMCNELSNNITRCVYVYIFFFRPLNIWSDKETLVNELFE